MTIKYKQAVEVYSKLKRRKFINIHMKMDRIWAMPNKNTFDIKPIKELIERYICELKKEEISRIMKKDGIAITCSWNSGGMGKKYGFEIIEILLVPHGGWHNDTIVTVCKKITI